MDLDPEQLKYFIEQQSGLSFRKNSRSWYFTCPRCDSRQKLYISRHNGRWICFKCAETNKTKGNAPERILAELLGCTVQEVYSSIYGTEADAEGADNRHLRGGIWEPPKEVDIDEQLVALEMLEEVEWPSHCVAITHKFAKKGVEYLASRGLPIDIAAEYGIKYSPVERRVYFPVIEDGALYGYQGRTVLPTEKWVTDNLEERSVLKIKSNIGLPRHKLVMFQDRLKGAPHALIAEGPMDAIKAHLCGGNVATMGKGVSHGQIGTILAYLKGVHRPKIYLALDPDAATEMQRLVSQLEGIEVYEMIAPSCGPEKADLGGMSFEEVYELFKSAPRVDSRRFFLFLG